MSKSIEKRIEELEDQVKKDEENLMQAAKEKVRCLALQSDPSELLILQSLQELATTAKRVNHSETAVYEETYRLAKINREKIDIPSFCLNVLGGKASDLVSKAMAKCFKAKPTTENSSASDLKVSNSKSDVSQVSPLVNLYPQYSMQGFLPMQGSLYPYGYMPPYMGQRRNFRNPSNFRQQGNRGTCHFCDSPNHLIRDCEKMKAAKGK